MHRIRAFSGLLCLLATTTAFSAQQPPAGQTSPGRRGRPCRAEGMVLHPTKPSLLAGEPTIEMGADGRRALMRFRTNRAVPGGACYFGTFVPDQRLPMPRYRWRVMFHPESPAKEHRVTLDLTRAFNPRYDVGRFAARGGGTVCYRLELIEPLSGGATARYGGRFAFRGDERVPCVVEGPFVDLVTTESAVISWRTDLPTTGAVLVAGRRHPSGKAPTTRHEVALAKLPAGSKIDYRVEIGAGESAERTRPFWFHTDARGRDTLTFAYMSDCRAGVGSGERALNGVNYRALGNFVRHAFHREAELILFGGDLVSGYTTHEADFRRELRTWKAAVEAVGHYLPIYEGLGNHDVLIERFTGKGANGRAITAAFNRRATPDTEAIFADEFVNPRGAPPPEHAEAPTYEENVYHFDRAGVRFIAFNTNYWYSLQPERDGGNLEGYVMDAQLAWIKQALAAAARDKSVRHVFLFGHEPAFPCGGHVQDAQWYSGGSPEKNAGLDRTYVVKRRDELWAAIAACPKTVAVFFGDEHNMTRMRVDAGINKAFRHPVWQIISGGCGAPYYALNKTVPWADRVAAYSAQQNYCLVRVDGDRVEMTVFGESGEVVERVVLKEGAK